VQIATELCEQVLELGAPGLHFYTLNRSRATLEIFEALRITV
jgi:methylenetetrahydrofolate reductase (NADPH)